MKQDTLNFLTYTIAKVINYMLKHPDTTINHLEQDILEISHLKDIRHIIHLEE